MAPRILIASFYHEGSSFSRINADSDAFVILEGEALLEKAAVSTASLGGAYRLLQARGAQIIPVLSAVTAPNGPVTDAAYNDISSRIVAAARVIQPDGIYLDLHGAMLTQSLDDPEGDLLSRLRKVVPHSVSIAVSLDLHAHVTDLMLANSDIIIACKENPHSDYDIAGERAAELLLDKLAGKVHPVTASVWIPLTFGCRMETAHGPLRHVHDLRRAFLAAYPEVLDISVYNTTTLVDAVGAGQSITVITNGDVALAEELAKRIAEDFWSRRDDFTPPFIPLETILDDIVAGRSVTPVVIGDQGDRVLAGTPGDSAFVIEQLASHYTQLRAVVPVTDPEVAAAAKAAGIGATLEIAVGGRMSEGQPSFSATWQVTGLTDGNFVQAGPYLGNEPARLGDTARLKCGNLTVLATSLPGFSQDREAFRSQGIVIEDQDVIVVKSGYHFRLSFDGLGTCVVADTPGLANYRPGLIPYRKRAGCYPEDPQASPDFAASIYNAAV